jgi:hypothetical protein
MPDTAYKIHIAAVLGKSLGNYKPTFRMPHCQSIESLAMGPGKCTCRPPRPILSDPRPLEGRIELMVTSTVKAGTTTKPWKMGRKRATDEVVMVKSMETSVINFADVYRLGPTERIDIIKKGVPAGVVVKLAQTIGRPKERLFKVLGLPRATVDRKMRANQRLSIEQGEPNG